MIKYLNIQYQGYVVISHYVFQGLCYYYETLLWDPVYSCRNITPECILTVSLQPYLLSRLRYAYYGVFFQLATF